MNKNLKYTLLGINLAMLVLSVLWFLRDKDFEPGLAILGQVIALLCILFEEKASNILTRGTTNFSKVKVRAGRGDVVKTYGTDNNSEVDIDTK
jgi:hypothetical protein